MAKYWYMGLNDKRIERDLMDKSWGEMIYTRQTLRMTNQMFKWKNLPETIPERIIEGYLQMYGQICFAEHEGNYYVFFGNAGGVPNEYYEPTEFIVANPYLNLSKAYTIGKDCVLMRNDSYYMGLIPIIERYAKQMVENDISILDAQYNMRIQSLIVATNDNARKSAELYMDRVKEGKPSIITAKGLTDEALSTKPFATAGTSNGISQLIELHQYLKAQLLSEFGINANYNMKRERINTAESELNQDALLPIVDDMLAMRKLACKQINEMFGLDIDVEKNSTWEIKEEMTEEAMNPEDAPMETDPVDEGKEDNAEDAEDASDASDAEDAEDAEETIETTEEASEEVAEAIENLVEEVVEEVLEGGESNDESTENV